MQIVRGSQVARVAALAAVLGLSAACVKEISSEERLERATSPAPEGDVPSAEALLKLPCGAGDKTEMWIAARNEGRSETERLKSFITLHTTMSGNVTLLETAMARNPDLKYQEGSEKLTAMHQDCVQLASDARTEFDRYLHALLESPTVDEVKGGNTVTMPRLDFGLLHSAIDALNAPDKDIMQKRMEMAEQKLGSTGKAVKKKK
jgi:hypothetical protein